MATFYRPPCKLTEAEKVCVESLYGTIYLFYKYNVRKNK